MGGSDQTREEMLNDKRLKDRGQQVRVGKIVFA